MSLKQLHAVFWFRTLPSTQEGKGSQFCETQWVLNGSMNKCFCKGNIFPGWTSS